MSAKSIMFFVCSIVLSWAAVAAMAQEAAAPQFAIKGAFVAEEGGFVTDASNREATLVTVGEYEPGQYVMTGEYKTEGMEALSMFAVDMKNSDGKTAFSGYDWTCASPQWTPFAMDVTIDAKGIAVFRVGNWQKCKGAESKLHIRNLQIKPQAWTDGMNLLINGDFEQTEPDYLPTTWYAKQGNDKSKTFPASNYAVVKNTSYKTGKNVLKLVAPGEGGLIMLNSRSFNLPASGDLELTFWAKGDKACVIRPRIVQSWSKQYTNVPISITDQWAEVSVNYKVQPDPKRKWFYVRLDMPTDQACTIEYADMKLIYRASHNGVDKPVAKIVRPAAPPAPVLPALDAKNLPSVAANPREYLIGVNLAGAEFSHQNLPGEEGKHFGWPTAATLDYYQARGFTLIRLPFLWERLQPTLGGELDAGYSAALVRTIQMIGERNMLVLLDLHNYAKYNNKTITQGGFTYEQFGDVWDRIAKLVQPQQKYIWGYGLMNEPYITVEQKIPFWQAGIDSVRKYDPKNRITVSGEALKGDPNPGQFHLKDPARAMVYETHFYFDHDNSGTYKKTYEEELARPGAQVGPMVGVNRLKKFVSVCEQYNVQCMVGEFGAPAGDGVDPRWLEAMENAMAFMHEHRITSTYWAGGEYWNRRGTSYIIGPNGWQVGAHEGEDRPQLKILQKYIELAKQGK